MSEIINNNDSYIVRTNGRIYVKLGGRYIALIDEDGNLNVKLKTSISTVSNFNDINSEGLYYYNGNIYAYANGSPYLLTGGGGSGDVINQVLSGDLRAVTSNAVYVTTENIKNNLANKVLPFEEFKTISSVVYNPTDITEGRVLYSLNLKCFILENTVGGRTTYYTNWKGSEKYQTIDSENVSQITLKPDVLYLFTNLSVGQASVRTLYMAKSSGNLTRILTDRDLNDVLTLDDVDTEITSSSSKPVASSAIYTALSKLGSIEYFDGTLSAEETINIIDSATTANDILILYSYKYKTFVAKYNNNYYKRWNTADKFFDGTTPNKHILFVCDDTLYFWNNDLVTVNVDNIDDCIIYVDLYMRGGLLPTPSASDLGKYAIVESNTYQLYRAEQFNNVISYTAKSFSKNRLYINDNKLYLWNGSELVQVGISEFNLLIAPFDGVINSATVQEDFYTGTGDILYITSLQRFAFRGISLNQTKYYNNWTDSGLYFGENRKPRKDTIYVNNGVGYVFDGTNGLVAIGGSTPSGPDSQQTVDQSLSTTSTNAIANKTVTTELNNLSGRVTTMEQSGVPSEVTADEVTVSAKNASGGNAAIHLASNPKSTVNSVGAIHVTDSTLPSSVSQNTKYIIYKDITTGNVENLNYIQLAPGTKIVPNGGIPKVPVVGGEMSWVHSSDIGMIQDGELPTGMTRAQVGAHNADVLRMVAAGRWNLILDGMYYVDVQIEASASRDTLLNNAVVLRRPLRIKGGGLTAARYLFCVEAGGGLVMEDVVLDNLESYAMIYIDPWGGLIESVELYRCTLKTSAAPKSGAPYAYVGRFVRGAGKNVGHVDWVNEYTPNGISRFFNETNGVKFLGLPRSVDVTEGGKTVKKSCWGLKNATASTPTQHYCYNGVPFPGSKNAVWADAWCCYDQGAQLYAPYAAGEYVFRQRADSKTKHKGMAGDFVPQSETRGTDTLYTENGTVVLFTPVYMHDDLVDGVLVRGANPDVEHNGIRKFIVDGCSIMSHSEVFIFGGLAVEEEFRISNNLFYEMVRQAMNLGTGNDDESSDYWNAMSCPLEVCGNTFRGVGYVVESDQPYACALLYEGNTILFHDNVLENLITTTNTYDCYLSCGKLEYRNNIIRNVLKWKNPDHSLYGYMKAKGTRDDFVYVNKYKDRMKSHPRKFSRLYEGNLFEENLKDVRQICESYLQKYRSTYLPDYDGVAWDDVPQEAKDDVLKENVLRTVFDNVVSPWSFDTFTVRNNIFDMPDCALDGSGVSGGVAKLRRFVFDGNLLKFRAFANARGTRIPSTASNTYSYFIYTVEATPGNAEVEIVGNRFESAGREQINLLCLRTAETLRSLRVEDNDFVGCGYRMIQLFRSQLTGDSPFYDGVIQADHLCVRNNREDAGLDEGYAGKYSVRRMYGTWYIPVHFRGHGGAEDMEEIWDSQRRGVSAPLAKMLALPVGSGGMTVRSTHWCRPMDVENAWNPKQGGPYEYSDKSLSLVYSFATLGREGGAGGIVPKGYCVSLRYCVKGQWKERKLEMRCSENLAGRAEGSTATELGVSVRGTDGRRICHKADVAAERAAYTRHGTVSARNTQVDWLDDLGLGFVLFTRAVMDTDFTQQRDYNTPMLRLALYTGADGTKNDPGTEITMTVTDIDPAADLAGEGGTKVLGATSPFESFVPKGSTLTSDERTALLTGDTIAFKVEPSDAGVVHSATLTAGDAGWWCVDPDSGQKVIWNGSAWEAEKKIVSLTLAAYDALTTKDENTLYLIVDA